MFTLVNATSKRLNSIMSLTYEKDIIDRNYIVCNAERRSVAKPKGSESLKLCICWLVKKKKKKTFEKKYTRKLFFCDVP